MSDRVVQLKDREGNNLYPLPPSVDYIVEQGTDGAWTYRKWASGIAECWGTVTETLSITGGWGSWYIESFPKKPFPSGLFNAPPAYVNAQGKGDGNIFVTMQMEAPTKDETPRWYLARGQSDASNSRTLYVRAIGRWK